mgnify:CR=1 FL=1
MFSIVVESILLFVGITACFSANWAINVFGNIDMKSIIFTLSTPIESTSSEILNSFLLKSLLPSVLISIIVFFILLFIKKHTRKNRSIINIIVCSLLSICLIAASLNHVGFFQYLDDINNESTFFHAMFNQMTDIA